MKILVAITNYGTTNMQYLHELLKEYTSMQHQVDIVVFSNIPKDLGSDIEVIVTMPTRDPWSLPFAHKQLFAQRRDDYDLFIYSEDDILITEKNITAFLSATEILPSDMIAGFLRYEIDGSGCRHCPDAHAFYHWKPDSVRSIDNRLFAHFTNQHCACYILTRQQLKHCIESDGFLKKPYRKRYDLACTAATDPYTNCMLEKVICISDSHFDSFLVHHLPNRYIGTMSLPMDQFKRQIYALMEIHADLRSSKQLFCPTTALDRGSWDKQYYQKCDDNILAAIPNDASSVLSVGCTNAETETALVRQGIHVTAIPVDSVISVLPELKGMTVLQPDFLQAVKAISHKKFDCIIFQNTLEHLEDPAGILADFAQLLSNDGTIIITLPNFRYAGTIRKRITDTETYRIGQFDQTHLHMTNTTIAKKWLKDSNLTPVRIDHKIDQKFNTVSKVSLGIMNDLIAPAILITARKSSKPVAANIKEYITKDIIFRTVPRVTASTRKTISPDWEK